MSLRWSAIRHGQVDSTNALALAEIEAGRARHGDLHVATGQTAGRGSRGRRWESAAGEGLYISAVLLPGSPIPPGCLTAAGALAVLDMAHQLGIPAARLKWPNDVLVGERKLSGVLAEVHLRDATAPGYVLGVGVNVLQAAFPRELEGQRPVTSLRREGAELTLAEAEALLEARLSARTELALAGCDSLSGDFLEGLQLGTTSIRVETPAGSLTGHLLALDLAGELELMGPTGRQRVRVEHVRALTPQDRA